MQVNWIRLLGAGAMALSLTAAPALSQPAAEEWDADQDARIDAEEFAAGVEQYGIWDGWDDNGDGLVSRDEFNEGVFQDFDADESGALEEPELTTLDEGLAKGWFGFPIEVQER